MLNVRYTGQADRGDLDLLVFEGEDNRLLVAMVKAFVPPDSVEEIVRANEALNDGLTQIGRARRWLEHLDATSWGAALRLSFIDTQPHVVFAVIGNGFAGSDYLTIPADVAVVDARYLLLDR